MDETTSAIAPDSRPCLPRGVRLVHNEAQGGWVLLAPERVFKAMLSLPRFLNDAPARLLSPPSSTIWRRPMRRRASGYSPM